jgi:hypothetical protein
MKDGTPWLPVAGETYGMVNEFSTYSLDYLLQKKKHFKQLTLMSY